MASTLLITLGATPLLLEPCSYCGATPLLTISAWAVGSGASADLAEAELLGLGLRLRRRTADGLRQAVGRLTAGLRARAEAGLIQSVRSGDFL